MRFFLIVLSILLLLGCQPLKTNNVKFEVKNFELKREENKSRFSTIESYLGKGTVIATGDQNNIKKPYLVLLKITRVSGGSETDTNKEWRTYILVDDGLGEFSTYDNSSEKKKFEKLEYKIEIIGYIPFILQRPTQTMKINFRPSVS
jgi:hypothetical protein